MTEVNNELGGGESLHIQDGTKVGLYGKIHTGYDY